MTKTKTDDKDEEQDSAVKTLAAWQQCCEESYRKVRKVMENAAYPKQYFFRLITFLMFPQTVLIFFIDFLTFSDFPHFFLKSS